MLRATTLKLPRATRSFAGLAIGVRHKTTVEAMKETADKVNKETGKVLADALGKAEKVTSTLTGSKIDNEPLGAAKAEEGKANEPSSSSNETSKQSVIMSSDGSFEVPLDEEMKK